MKAFVLRDHGPDGARLETDFPDPAPGEGDVVVRVRATSLNYHDVFTRRGMPGIRIAMPAIMGLDVAGEKVLVLGASGGVGVCAVQLAKAAGANVIAATSSEEKAARLRALGADHTINYANADFVQQVWDLYGKPARRGAGSDRGVDVV